METPQETTPAKRVRYNKILIGIGLFLLFCNMIYASRIILLDLVGKRVEGTLSIREYGCSARGRNTKCQTALVDYYANDKLDLTFDAGITPILWDKITTIGKEDATHVYDVEVRYFSFYPYMAKMSLPLHIENLDPFTKRSLLGSLSIWPFVIIIAGYLTLKLNQKRNSNTDSHAGQPDFKNISW